MQRIREESFQYINIQNVADELPEIQNQEDQLPTVIGEPNQDHSLNFQEEEEKVERVRTRKSNPYDFESSREGEFENSND